MPTTVTNWSEFSAAVSGGDQDILITGEIVIPTATVYTVPHGVTLSFEAAGYFNFSNDATIQLIIDGWINANPQQWIFRNTVGLPVEPTWGGGGSNPNSTSEKPSVWGAYQGPRHTGWWGCYNGVPGSTTIQHAIDSAPRKTGGQNDAVTVVLGAIGHKLLRPIQLTGRNYVCLQGPPVGYPTINIQDDATFVDDSPGSYAAAFYQDDAPEGDSWLFGLQVRRINFTLNPAGLSVFRIHSAAEGSIIENCSGSWTRHFLRIVWNAIGITVRDCHFTGHANMDEDSRFLYTPGLGGIRMGISDVTYNHASGGGSAGALLAFVELGSGQLHAERVHVEDTRNIFLVGNSGVSDPSIVSAKVVANCIDGGRWPEPVPGDPLTAQNCFFAVKNWDYSQVVASGMQVGPGAPGAQPPYHRMVSGGWWIKCVDDELGRDGEVPVNSGVSWGGTGQGAFGCLMHNARAARNPSRRMPGIRNQKDIPSS